MLLALRLRLRRLPLLLLRRRSLGSVVLHGVIFSRDVGLASLRIPFTLSPRGMRARLKQFTSRMTRSSRAPAVESVTLVIYGWHESEPGTLAWVFPSVRSALRAVRAMRNAVRWLIVRGKRAFDRDAPGRLDIDELRRAGLIIAER
jgi:hypothetical protein